jgi:hypothetical protein
LYLFENIEYNHVPGNAAHTANTAGADFSIEKIIKIAGRALTRLYKVIQCSCVELAVNEGDADENRDTEPAGR